MTRNDWISVCVIFFVGMLLFGAMIEKKLNKIIELLERERR